MGFEKLSVDLGNDDLLSGTGAAVNAVSAVAKKTGLDQGTVNKIQTGAGAVKGTAEVGKTVLGLGVAVNSATGLTVAATSGAGITSGLAGAGSIVGGGMAMGPAVIAAGPAYLGAAAINKTLFKDKDGLREEERRARKAARFGTNVGAVGGLAGVGAVTVAGGASGAGIMSTLAAIGSVVGGGAIAGTTVLAAAPVVTAVGVGYFVYRRFGGKR